MISRMIDKAEEALSVALLAAMTLTTFSQVVARYIFNSGAVWALELTTYMFAWLVLLGAARLVKTSGHLGVTAFVSLFATRTQRVFGVIAGLACLIYSGLLLWGAWSYVSRIYDIGILAHDLHVPKWIPLLALPIGLGLLLFRFGQVLVAILLGKRLGVIEELSHQSSPDTKFPEE